MAPQTVISLMSKISNLELLIFLETRQLHNDTKIIVIVMLWSSNLDKFD